MNTNPPILTMLVGVAFLAALGLSQPLPAQAATAIDGCNQGTGSVDLYLDDDIEYDWDDPVCVTVQDGHNLDMKGHKITCVPGPGHDTCQNPAIKCVGTNPAGSKVEDTVSGASDSDAQHVNISGPAAIGVLECGTVQKVKMDGPLVGISVSGTNGKVYEKNVIAPAETGIGMDLVLQDNTDRVFNNRIDGGNYGIRIVGKASTSGPQLDHNVIRGFRVAGIYNGDATYFKVEDNALVEGGEHSVPMLIGSANAAYAHNVCEIGGPCDCELDYLTPETGVNPPSSCF